jgi:hypothetical protein
MWKVRGFNPPPLFPILLVVLALNLTSPACAAPFLVGTWFGTGQPGDKGEMWIARMGADGSFHAQFRSCARGKATDLFQTGSWVLNGDMETISVTSVNGVFYLRNDSYKILSHDQNRQTYRYLPTGFVYNSRRVDEKFQMPECEAIS